MNTYTRLWRELRTLYADRNEPENIRPLADAYWRLMLSLAVLLTILALGWGAWVFVDTLALLSSSSPSTTTPPTALDRTKLQGLLAAYQSRQEAVGTPTSSTNKVADPSK